MKQKRLKQLGAALLAGSLVVSSGVSASACCGLYVGSQQSENGSTYVGRSEDIGKLYDKVFEVRPAADHAEGEMYEDTYGFSMPYPSHTYRYTVLRDSIEQGESVVDEDGNLVREAYGEVGMNEKGVSVSATVSTSYNANAKAADPLVDTGICEISLTSVILMSADSARDGVEKLAAIIDTYGSGECNSFTISDANEVWDFETLSGHQYVAMKMPDDKVSVNPNMVVMNEIDVSDPENVVASADLISLPLENGFLVSSQQGKVADDQITKIDIQKTYGSEDFGNGQYFRYWQGVNYLNEELSQSVSVERDGEAAPEGPFNMLFEADHQLTTYEVLRLLACRGEGTEYAADNNPEKNPNGTAIGNERQAECHVFEIRSDMPEALATIQWQTMSRAEFSVYLPYYSNLLTDTSDIFQTEYSPSIKDIEEVLDDEDFPAETSAYWVFTAINDLCDNDRERYGANVKLYWENYQKALIEQQEAVDESMTALYEKNPELAEQAATALAKGVSEEAFENAKIILTELRAFIAADQAGELTEEDVFTPSVLTENKMPTYSMDMAYSFDDVDSSAWYADAVSYVAENGIMNGAGNGTFAPDTVMSRAMLVQVLYNLEGKPEAADCTFTDVAADAWYADAVAWAADAGIVTGVSDITFAPDQMMTREQIATILYRYAAYKNYDVTASNDLSSYTDAGQIGSYAVEAMQWANGAGLITGSTATTLNPLGSATRAEVATILMRFLESVG
ncbi:C69 family dipeptidase [Flavonifractor sp. An112]|uniref:C69 family dipeptidase n=1 Tax=Flavonifractor sp. An112 TaxID=1965544 RepID=UPI00174D1A58|nr:C69 family dipeptidase [Flavonifractor sp. An112]HIZ94923.1 C69 family dipeptidase [Candidatus Flavonifractor avicola]